jgi:hypothetical protein
VKRALVIAAALALGTAPAFAAPSPPRDLPSPAAAASGEPFLAASPGGAPGLSWLEARPGGGHRLRYATRGGGRWSTPVTVAEGDSFFVNWADFPSVVALDGGVLAAHWLWKVGGGTYAYHVRLAFSRDGGRTWSKPLTPHRDGTPTEHGFVSLAAEGGSLRALWLDGRHTASEPPGAMTLRTARIAPDGTIDDEHELDDRVCDCCQTALVRGPRGWIAAYRDRSESEVRDIAVAREVDGRWLTPQVIPGDGWTFAACPVNGPALAAAGERVVLAWFTAASDSPRVKVAVSEDGGATFGPALRLDGGGALGRVDVAMAADGRAVVSWMEREGEGAAVRHRARSRAGAWGETRTVARSSSARSSGFPQVVLHGDEVLFARTDDAKPARVRVGSYRLPR